MAEENNELNNNQNNNHVEVQEKQPKNIWKIFTIVLVILLIIVYIRPFSGGISEGEAKTKALTYINSLLQGRAVADIKSIESKGDLYKMTIDINGEEMPTYMTKDGSLLFPTALDLTTPIQSITGSTTQEIPKTKKPSVKLFVMSQCPYGVLAENAIAPVLGLLKDKISFNLFFIADENNGQFQSLHGQPEVDEDTRQLCVIKYYPEAFMDYILCINKDAANLPWESCLNENKMDVNKIKTCSSGEEGKKLLSENIKEAEKYQVTGSPTLIINEVVYQGQRTPEAYKQAVCSAFNKELEECKQVLSTQQAQASGSCN